MTDMKITAECGKPEHGIAGRFVTLKLGQFTIYHDLVYDTDSNDERTEEQAIKNATFIVGAKLRFLLENA